MSKLFEYAIDVNNLHNLEDYILENGTSFHDYSCIDNISKINEILDCNIVDYIKNSINTGIFYLKNASTTRESFPKAIEREEIDLIYLVNMDASDIFNDENGEDYCIRFMDIFNVLIKKDFSKVIIYLLPG